MLRKVAKFVNAVIDANRRDILNMGLGVIASSWFAALTFAPLAFVACNHAEDLDGMAQGATSTNVCLPL